MSVCPTPQVQAATDYATVASFTSNIPDVQDEQCAGGNSVVEIAPGGSNTSTTVCCPTPGPPGPAGPAGDCGETWDFNEEWADATDYEVYDAGVTTCQTDIVRHNSALYKALDTHTSTTDDEPGVGANWEDHWEFMIAAGAGSSINPWFDTYDYLEGDLVTYETDGKTCTYSADEDHTADPSNAPDYYTDGGFYWTLLSCTTTEQAGLLDNLLGGVFDWLGDWNNWDWQDWALAIAGGVGLYIAGTELIDLFNEDPIGDGAAGSNYTGDTLYNPAGHTAPQLDDVLGHLSEMVGVTYDVSQLNPTEVNFGIGTVTSVRNVIEMLTHPYLFLVVDSAGQAVFKPRLGASSVKTLTLDNDCGFVTQGSVLPAKVATKRLQGETLPREVNIEYISEAAGYNSMVQTAALETYEDGQVVHRKLPIMLGEQEAYDVAEAILINAHMERTNRSYTTSYQNIELEVGDIITLDQYGDQLITRIDEKRTGVLEHTVIDASFNTEAFTASGIGPEAPPTYTDTPTVIGYSDMLVLELPPLDETDTEMRLAVCPHGGGLEDWQGCVVYYSYDNNNYFSLGNTATETTWGKVVTPLADVATTLVWDETSTFEVELKTGELESVTHEDVYNRQNWCYLGQELLGVRNFTLTAPNTYTASGLLRGLQGTEYFTDSHVANEGFILLDNAIIEFPYSLAQKNATVWFKAVSVGSDISKATARQVTPSGATRRPWQVAHLDAVQEGDDWIVTWVARNQFNGTLEDGVEVINPDGFAGFIIEFLDGGDNVVHTVTQQTSLYRLRAATQTAEMGGLQSNIKVRVLQLDLKVGPGYPQVGEFS